MFKTVEELAILYNKIKDGIANEAEMVDYEISIATACMREDVLLKMIKEKANELRKN